MNPSLAKALLADRQPGVQLLYGVATGLNTVEIAGSTVAVELPAMEPVVAGDYVAVLAAGADRLILGKVGDELIQRGRATVTLDSGGLGTITFPVAFASEPYVSLTVQLSTTAQRTAHINTLGTSSVAIRCYSFGTMEVSTTRVVHWVARGPVT